MKLKFAIGLATLLAIAISSPVLAKTKAKATQKGSGIICTQGGRSHTFPAASLKPSLRNRLVVGRTMTVNFPGYGPYKCRVY